MFVCFFVFFLKGRCPTLRRRGRRSEPEGAAQDDKNKMARLVRAFSLCLLLHPATIRLPARGSLLTRTGACSAQVHRIPAPCSLSPCGMCVGPPLELGSVSSLSSLLVHNLNPSPSSIALLFVQNFASPAPSDEALRQCSFNLEISSSSFGLVVPLICGCPVSQVGLVASLALLYERWYCSLFVCRGLVEGLGPFRGWAQLSGELGLSGTPSGIRELRPPVGTSAGDPSQTWH